MEPWQPNDCRDRSPEAPRVQTGHRDSHAFLTHEIIRATVEGRHPSVNGWGAAASTAPGIAAHASAIADGELHKGPDYRIPPFSPAVAPSG